MSHSEYLLLNIVIFALSTVSILVAKTLTKKALFPQLRPTILALFSVSLPYVIWDVLVTNWWWQFNPQYILGFQIGPLPIEELLFFMVVPWSCLVIWVNLKPYIKGTLPAKTEELVILFGIFCLCLSFFRAWWYTVAISMLLIIFAVWSKCSDHWLKEKSSLFFLTISFGLICIFNGYLTTRPIVTYTQSLKSNVHIGSIPIEDFGYGLVLVGAISQFYELYSRRLLVKKDEDCLL